MRFRLATVLGFFLALATGQTCLAPDAAVAQQPRVVPWTFLSPAGDTVAGRVTVNVDTVSARQLKGRTDTLWCGNTAPVRCSSTRPPVPAGIVSRPIAFGAYNTPLGSYAGSSYSGGAAYGWGPGMLRDLATARAAKARIWFVLGRNKSRTMKIVGTDTTYLISTAEVRRDLTVWPDSVALKPFVDDGTLRGIVVSDDILGKEHWGPKAPYLATIDSFAMLIKQRVGSRVLTAVRAKPGDLAKDGVTGLPYTWRWLDSAWGQYSNIPRDGDVKIYRDIQFALAANLRHADGKGLCVVFGLNIVNGGDGSSGIPGQTGRWRMSPAEVVRYYTAFLGYTSDLIHWEYRAAYDTTAAYRAAYAQVRTLADAKPATSCKGR